MSPEQTAQLATVPRAQPVVAERIEESTATGDFCRYSRTAPFMRRVWSGVLVRFDPVTGKQTGNVNTRHQLSGGVGAGDGMLLVGTLKGEVLAYGEQRR